MATAHQHFGEQHKLVRREDKDTVNALFWRCENCLKWFGVGTEWLTDAREWSNAEAALKRGRCGFPAIGEDWTAGGVRGHVVFIHTGVMFKIKPYDGGPEREFPWGTPDETPTEAA